MLQISPLCGVQQGGGLPIVQGLYLLPLIFGQYAPGGGIFGYVVQVDGPLQRRAQDHVNVPDRLRGQLQGVYKGLDVVGVEAVQADGSQGGLDVQADVALIGGAGGRLYPAQIVPLPNVQPFPHRHLGGRGVGAPVDLHGHGLHLLHNFPLCLAGESPLDLSAGERVPARGDTGLPIGVSLAVAGVRALVDAPRPVCGSFRHDVPPFSIDTPGPPVVH